MSPRAPAHVETFRAVDSGQRMRAKVVTTIGANTMNSAIPIGPIQGFASAPRPPGVKKIQATCAPTRSEEHTSELQSHHDLVCRLLLEKKKKKTKTTKSTKQKHEQILKHKD